MHMKYKEKICLLDCIIAYNKLANRQHNIQTYNECVVSIYMYVYICVCNRCGHVDYLMTSQVMKSELWRLKVH